MKVIVGIIIGAAAAVGWYQTGGRRPVVIAATNEITATNWVRERVSVTSVYERTEVVWQTNTVTVTTFVQAVRSAPAAAPSVVTVPRPAPQPQYSTPAPAPRQVPVAVTPPAASTMRGARTHGRPDGLPRGAKIHRRFDGTVTTTYQDSAR